VVRCTSPLVSRGGGNTAIKKSSGEVVTSWLRLKRVGSEVKASWSLGLACLAPFHKLEGKICKLRAGQKEGRRLHSA